METVIPAERPARGLLGPGLFVGVAVVVANALNAVFQIALARILDPEEYSLLVALVVITLIAAVPPLAFQATVAREVAVALAEEPAGRCGRCDPRHGARARPVGARRSSSLGALAYPLLAAAGRGDAGATFATAATISAALVIPAVWGGLQGARLFVVLGIAHLTFAGTRLGAGVGHRPRRRRRRRGDGRRRRGDRGHARADLAAAPRSLACGGAVRRAPARRRCRTRRRRPA